MADKAPFSLRERNPDVLTSIANLSNDEVFTPPSFANQMLDTVEEAWAKANDGANIWADKTVTFLDPFTKSGVFLREIVRRLSEGLEQEIPDLQERVNHILTKQVFGVAITQLTALLARRSVYCSKWANGPHSIATEFTTPEGNIWFERTEHTWVGGKERIITVDDEGNEVEKTVDGKCKFCGAKQSEYDRGFESESHAYSLIHAADLETWVRDTFGAQMQFDVIVGNPPYQLSTEGFGTQARPIYQLFVKQALSLSPRFLTMVIPARWFAGGMGLDEFRNSMLSDVQIRTIEDFPNSNEVFPGTQIKGGICYFLWANGSSGEVLVANHMHGLKVNEMARPLREPGFDVFIRFNQAIPILRKVLQAHIPAAEIQDEFPDHLFFKSLVGSIGAFGLQSTFRGRDTGREGDVKVYRNGGVGFIEKSAITGARDLIPSWKVFIPRAGSGSDDFPHPILGRPFLGEPDTVSSWTYIPIGPFGSEQEARNVLSYISTRLFRFLVLLHKPSQDATKSVYSFVPLEDFSKPWTDEELYAKYKLTDDEISFIESMIRPMELDSE